MRTNLTQDIAETFSRNLNYARRRRYWRNQRVSKWGNLAILGALACLGTAFYLLKNRRGEHKVNSKTKTAA